MTALLDQPQTKYLGVAILMLGATWGIIKWIGRTLRSLLGTRMPRTLDAAHVAHVAHVDSVPPVLVKQAIERGLVTPSQLAAMAPMERQFLFASFQARLSEAAAKPESRSAPAPATGGR